MSENLCWFMFQGSVKRRKRGYVSANAAAAQLRWNFQVSLLFAIITCICSPSQSGTLSFCGHPQNYTSPCGCCFWPSVRTPPEPSALMPGSQRRPGMKNRRHSELSGPDAHLFISRLVWSRLLERLKTHLALTSRRAARPAKHQQQNTVE